MIWLGRPTTTSLKVSDTPLNSSSVRVERDAEEPSSTSCANCSDCTADAVDGDVLLQEDLDRALRALAVGQVDRHRVHVLQQLEVQRPPARRRRSSSILAS